MANTLDEMEFCNLWAVAHILNHGESRKKLTFDGEDSKYLLQLEAELGATPFSVVVGYTWQESTDKLNPVMIKVHEFMVRQGVIDDRLGV